MQAVDSNIVVRYLVGDDPKQAEQARGLIGRVPVLVPRTVLLEVEWVLRAVHGLKAAQVIPALRALAGLPGVTVENSALVARAMGWAEAGMDFADALHLAASSECEQLMTFDKAFIRAAAKCSGVRVDAP